MRAGDQKLMIDLEWPYDSVRSIWVTIFSRSGGETGLSPSDITTVS